jgi:sugar lactone lactonase YvrE
MNDGKVDPGGRFWAGSMHTEERRNAGSLYRLEPDGQVTVMIEHVTISNGLAWSPDRQTFYFIDSATREVAAYEHDPSDGSLGARRVAVRIADGAGTPDGMAIDTEGLLWVALWDGWAVHRYAPDGELVDIVEVPVARPTCPVFGGPDLRQLFVTSARLGADKDRAQPLAGSVFVTEVETAGTPCNRVSAAPAA